jgi:23S rRNA (guanine745-N1)-methyltransferase
VGHVPPARAEGGIIGGVLADVASYLCCPHCPTGPAGPTTAGPAAGALALSGPVLCCPRGHRFDVARQGYVSLLPGDARTGTADTAAMVAARQDFLASGEYAALTAAVSDTVTDALADADGAARPGCLVDAGGGTGHHLAAALDRRPERVGVCCDLSRYAARRAARAHPRIGAVVADVWRALPVRDGAAAAVVNVFAPRNAEEFHRVLAPGGALVVVTPRPDHLAEVVGRLGLLSVDEDKPGRLDRALGERFDVERTRDARWTMRLSHAAVQTLVQMGPSAWHTAGTPDVTALPDPVEVTGAVTVSTYRRR